MGRRAFIAVLVGLAAVWILLPIPLNRLVSKNLPLLQQEIATALGRPVVFEDVRFSFWGAPALTAKNLRIADDPHFAATPFIEAKELRMPLSWLSLLRGKISIKRYILTGPEIQIVRNELGDLNLLSRAVAQEGSKAYFFTAPLEIADGTIDFVDRSVKEPIEIRVQNLSLALSDYDREGARKLRLTANVFPVHGQEKNLTLDGWVKPSTAAPDWTSFPLDVRIRTDGLLIANLVRAVPALRDTLANYVDLVGPVRLETRLRGSIVHPHISNLWLAGAFFGSTKTNVRLSGEINCLGADSCLDSPVQSEIKLDSVELARLRKLPFLEPVVPESISAEGPMTVAAELTGNLNRLNVRARIQAKESSVRLRQWLAKPRGTPASLELAMIVQKDQTRFEDSLLRLHNLKLQFSGFLERAPKPQLILHVRTDGVELAGWEKILQPVSRYRLRGTTQFELAVARSLDAKDPRTTIRGNLNLHGVQVHDQQSRRRIEDAQVEMVFTGAEARVTDASFRLGSTPMKLQGALRNFSDPVFQYVLRSPKLRLADLDELPAQPADAMTTFHATGELRAGNGTPSIRNAFFVSSGSWQGLPYRNLNAEVVWSAESITVKALSVEALGGDFAASGSFGISDRNRLPLDVGVRVRNLDVNHLPANGYFNSPYSLEGRLSIDARFHGKAGSWNEIRQSLTGKGKANLSSGVLRNFNLAGAVLSNVNGLPGVVNLVAAGNAAENEIILAKRDTVFNSLEASFAVEKGRLSTRDFNWKTDDYTAFGEGWIDLDRSMRWNATLVMSPGFSQIVAQEHGNIRYLLDRNGRLVVPFRVEGTLRRPQIKPDIKRLAEVIQRGLLGRAPAPRRSAATGPQQKKKSK